MQDDTGVDVGNVCKVHNSAGETGLKSFVAAGERRINGLPEDTAAEICPPVVLALQIETDECGISSRVNMAEIDMKA